MFLENRREKLLTLGAMCFALFMAMLDNTVVNVALPKIQSTLNSGTHGLQWVVDSYTLPLASLMLTGGTLGDMYGRKRAFQWGLLLFTLGSLLCALAPALGYLIAGRTVQGVGAAVLMPGTLSILTNTFPDHRERAQAIGIWSGVSALALVAGPVLGGFLVDSLGWQSVFYLNLPVGIVAMAAAWCVVPESYHREGRSLDLAGQLLAVVALGALTFALIEGPGHGWGNPLIVGLGALAAACGAAFIVVERRHRSPMLQLGFFRDLSFAMANLAAGLVAFGMFGSFFFLSLYFQNVQGYSAAATGARFVAVTGAVIFISPLAGRLVGKVGARPLMFAGQLLAGSSLLLLLTTQPDTAYAAIGWKFTMMGIGLSLTNTPMTTVVMSAVPPQRAGMASAAINTSRQVGGVLGIAVLGSVVISQMVRSLVSSLSELGVPAPARDAIVAAAVRGQLHATDAAGNGASSAGITDALAQSFVAGMHSAMLIAGIGILISAALTFRYVRDQHHLPEMEPELNATAALEI